MTFQAGVEQKVRIFCTDAFKAESPALTLVIREACSRGLGWTATSFEEARKKDGWKWGLVLRGKTEEVAPVPGRCKKNLSLNGDDLITWATRGVYAFRQKRLDCQKISLAANVGEEKNCLVSSYLEGCRLFYVMTQ